MFSDTKENYRMLLGAYKKLKSYYHYNKNFLFMKKKIADFEYDNTEMERTLEYLSILMVNPKQYEKEIDIWINQLDFYVMPKAFKEDGRLNDRFVTNDISTNKRINKVNFFINMPIELHLLETVWILFIGKFVSDKHIISKNCYGNVLDSNVLFNKEEDLVKSINFEKNKLFKIYFGQYCEWKNKAIDTIDTNKKEKSTLMISLDIQSYYYSVIWKFNLLDDLIGCESPEKIRCMTNIIEKIFDKYTSLISDVREIKQDVRKKEYVLPIGLFSSMVLSNMYLSEFDKRLENIKDVIYYGRYVDDMLIVMDISGKIFKCDDKDLDNLLINENSILNDMGNDIYCIDGHKELLIQKAKLKVILFECGKSNSLINQLKKTKVIPSQMNIVPEKDIKIPDFEEAAYVIQNFSNETKIREFGQLEINKFQLGWHMAEIVKNSKYKMNQLSKNEKVKRQYEVQQILLFFQGSNALEYNSNWINALYYFMLTKQTDRNAWKKFEANIRSAIKNMRVENPESIKKGKTNQLKSLMKKQLCEQLNICIATVLAINPEFCKKETFEAKQLAYKLRKANYFNHYLVTYPLINYIDDLDENIDLTDIKLEQLAQWKFNIHDSRKMKFNPRFINLDELFQFAFLEGITQNKGWNITDEKISFVKNVFYKFNNINKLYAKPLQIEVHNRKCQDDYHLQEICIEGKQYDLDKLRIAVANIKLGIKDCCLGIENSGIMRNRSDFIKFLKDISDTKNGKVDFVLFPEFYLPLQWISDVLAFVRKAGITIISGMQYIAHGDVAHNNIGIFTQINSGKYRSSCMIIREKNDYAPFEKKLLAIKGYKCIDHGKSSYSIIKCGNISIGSFLCYEFTDIVARSLFKDRVDILFAPENNNDTTYFSGIIETMTRDLHTIVVQANTSIYGDSRITGPYSRDQRNIVQIKGGDNDSIVIGTIDLNAIRNSRKKEREQLKSDIDSYLKASPKEKYIKEKELLKTHDLKIAKVSAKTRY